MDKNRFCETRETRHSISEPTHDDPVLVICPKCKEKGVVLPMEGKRVKMVCSNCGFNSTRDANKVTYHWHKVNPTDGYFGYDLWLTTDCAGKVLWAFNKKHLHFLESYVIAGLRERKRDDEYGWHNSSLASRLPKWITSGKNRSVVVKAIEKLKEKV